MNQNNRTASTTRLAASLSLALFVAACGSKATTNPSGLTRRSSR